MHSDLKRTGRGTRLAACLLLPLLLLALSSGACNNISNRTVVREPLGEVLNAALHHEPSISYLLFASNDQALIEHDPSSNLSLEVILSQNGFRVETYDGTIVAYPNELAVGKECRVTVEEGGRNMITVAALPQDGASLVDWLDAPTQPAYGLLVGGSVRPHISRPARAYVTARGAISVRAYLSFLAAIYNAPVVLKGGAIHIGKTVAAHEVVPETEAEKKAEKGDDEAKKGLRNDGK
jgi:hypothetical protein